MKLVEASLSEPHPELLLDEMYVCFFVRLYNHTINRLGGSRSYHRILKCPNKNSMHDQLYNYYVKMLLEYKQQRNHQPR